MNAMARKAKPAAAENDQPDEEPAEAEERPSRPAPRPVSVPAKASCLTFVFLVLAVVAAIAYFLIRRETIPYGWQTILLICVLLIAIPVVVYRAVTLWLFDESARYPDIGYAWKAGIAELADHGMTLDSAPLFFIVGTGSDKMRRSFMEAANGNFFINGAGDPGGPLYWYANNDAIFLYLNDICWANAAISLYETSAQSRHSGLPGEHPQASAGKRKLPRHLGTLVPDFRPGGAPQVARQPEMAADRDEAGPDTATPDAAPMALEGGERGQAPRKAAAGNYFGTITPGQVMAPTSNAEARARAAAEPAGRATAGTSRAVNRLTSQQSSLQLQRLLHLCGVLRRRRHPVCPINGILVLLPFEMLKAKDQEVAEVARAISADLSTIYNETQLRCPVTAVIVGMDQERGFRELIRRIGQEEVAKQRFGQKFDLRIPSTVDELRKFNSHVCGTFEDWVYTLFRQDEALSHPGNTFLYALLCKVRRVLKEHLGNVLGNGFGRDPQSNKIPVLFSGCYFTATGRTSDRQAFVSGLLSKLYDEQEEIEWTDAALREDRRRGWLIKIGWALSAGTVLAIVGYFITLGKNPFHR
jgi:hypothetical protein